MVMWVGVCAGSYMHGQFGEPQRCSVPRNSAGDPQSHGRHSKKPHLGNAWVNLNITYNIAAARAVDREFNYNFGSNLGLFGVGRGVNRRGAPAGFIWTEFQLERSHGDPFHARNSRLCATGSNSDAPGSQEISPLTSRIALKQRSVSWGSHLSGFCSEQSHGDLLHDQHVPHIECCFAYSLFFLILLSSFFLFLLSLSS